MKFNFSFFAKIYSFSINNSFSLKKSNKLLNLFSKSLFFLYGLYFQAFFGIEINAICSAFVRFCKFFQK